VLRDLGVRAESAGTKDELRGGEGEAAGRPVDVLVDKSTCFTRIGTFTEKDKQVLQEYYATAQEIGAIETVPDLDAVFDGAVEREY